MAISKIDTNAIANDAVTSTKIDDSQITLGFRNKIIGGNFSTNPWQRGTSFPGPTNDWTADRFKVLEQCGGVVFVLKTADAPTIAEAGVFTQHCLHVDVTTADTSVDAGDYAFIEQRIEGYNVLDLGFGQSGTRYVTLSFWHKHTKTGTHCVALENSAQDRSYVAEYTQTTTDTWEKAEITIPVDTSGTWLYDNGVGLRVQFCMMVGSTYAGTAGSWSGSALFGSSNQVNNLDSTSNNFKIALVQLEAGQTATAFENRSVGQELELCQRYFEKSYDQGTSPGTATSTGAYQSRDGTSSAVSRYYPVNYKVTKRANPTVTAYDLAGTASRITIDASNGWLAGISGNGDSRVMIYGNQSLASHYAGFFHYTIDSEL